MTKYLVLFLSEEIKDIRKLIIDTTSNIDSSSGKINDETSLDGSNARYKDLYERIEKSIKKLIK